MPSFRSGVGPHTSGRAPLLKPALFFALFVSKGESKAIWVIYCMCKYLRFQRVWCCFSFSIWPRLDLHMCDRRFVSFFSLTYSCALTLNQRPRHKKKYRNGFPSFHNKSVFSLHYTKLSMRALKCCFFIFEIAFDKREYCFQKCLGAGGGAYVATLAFAVRGKARSDQVLSLSVKLLWFESHNNFAPIIKAWTRPHL